MNNKKIERLIYKSLDIDLPKKEAKKLHQELLRSEALLDKFIRIESIRQAISKSAETSFKPNFEERLLAKINNLPKGEAINPSRNDFFVRTFRKVALTALLILIALVSYNIGNGNKYSIENLLGTREITVENAFDPFHNLIGSEK